MSGSGAFLLPAAAVRCSGPGVFSRCWLDYGVALRAAPIARPGAAHPLFSGGREISAGLTCRCRSAEDLAQQVVGAELAGDLAQRVVRQAQFLGQQVERGVAPGAPAARASARCSRVRCSACTWRARAMNTPSGWACQPASASSAGAARRGRRRCGPTARCPSGCGTRRRRGVGLVEDVQQPLVGARAGAAAMRARRRRRSRARRGASGRAGTAPHRRAAISLPAAGDADALDLVARARRRAGRRCRSHAPARLRSGSSR